MKITLMREKVNNATPNNDLNVEIINVDNLVLKVI